ncbi:hypothetical protein XELAEV_18001311mg [Xenopus laevis]|nr:hypothetical protein XELAEV_18001311mg [Xenopus laevis]
MCLLLVPTWRPVTMNTEGRIPPGSGSLRLEPWLELVRVSAECGVLDFEAKGPNVSAGVEASATGASVRARAELASVTASVGPLNATLALGVDTGVEVGEDGFGVQFLGTGFKVGPRSIVSLLGCKLEFPLTRPIITNSGGHLQYKGQKYPLSLPR